MKAVLWVGALLLVAGCGGRRHLAELPPYPEEFQRAWFEALNHLVKGDAQLAYTKFLECEALEPEEASLHYELGRLDVRLGRPGDAVVRFTRAVEAEPGNRWYREARASALLDIGQAGEALDDVEAILEARPGDVEVVYVWAEAFAEAGAPLLAIAVCDAYERTVAPDPEVSFQRLYYLEQAGRYEELAAALERGAVRFPDVVEFQLEWARMLLNLSDIPRAAGVISPLYAAEPNDGPVALLYAHVMTAAGRTKEAETALETAFRSPDVTVDEKLEILSRYVEISAFDEELAGRTEQLIGWALEQHGTSAPLLILAADVDRTAGRIAEARARLEQVVEAYPGLSDTWTNLLALDEELNDFEAWVRHARAAGEVFPAMVQFAGYEAMGLVRLGRHAEAAEAVRRVLPRARAFPEAEAELQAVLGDALHVVGDHAGCATALERSLALQPDNPTVLNNHAWYLALQGEQLDRAEACSRRALELSPGNANLLDTRAWVLHRMGRNAEALVAMEEAVRMSEWPDPVFLEHLGEIRWALGDADGAREAWRAAIEAGSTSPDLPAKLNQLP